MLLNFFVNFSQWQARIQKEKTTEYEEKLDGLGQECLRKVTGVLTALAKIVTTQLLTSPKKLMEDKEFLGAGGRETRHPPLGSVG